MTTFSLVNSLLSVVYPPSVVLKLTPAGACSSQSISTGATLALNERMTFCCAVEEGVPTVRAVTRAWLTVICEEPCSSMPPAPSVSTKQLWIVREALLNVAKAV